MEKSDISRDFSAFSVTLSTGSRAKKRLSNRLKISVPTDRTEVAVSMTVREARALRNFLNEHLKE